MTEGVPNVQWSPVNEVDAHALLPDAPGREVTSSPGVALVNMLLAGNGQDAGTGMDSSPAQQPATSYDTSAHLAAEATRASRPSRAAAKRSRYDNDDYYSAEQATSQSTAPGRRASGRSTAGQRASSSSSADFEYSGRGSGASHQAAQGRDMYGFDAQGYPIGQLPTHDAASAAYGDDQQYQEEQGGAGYSGSDPSSSSGSGNGRVRHYPSGYESGSYASYNSDVGSSRATSSVGNGGKRASIKGGGGGGKSGKAAAAGSAPAPAAPVPAAAGAGGGKASKSTSKTSKGGKAASSASSAASASSASRYAPASSSSMMTSDAAGVGYDEQGQPLMQDYGDYYQQQHHAHAGAASGGSWSSGYEGQSGMYDGGSLHHHQSGGGGVGHDFILREDIVATSMSMNISGGGTRLLTAVMEEDVGSGTTAAGGGSGSAWQQHHGWAGGSGLDSVSTVYPVVDLGILISSSAYPATIPTEETWHDVIRVWTEQEQQGAAGAAAAGVAGAGAGDSSSSGASHPSHHHRHAGRAATLPAHGSHQHHNTRGGPNRMDGKGGRGGLMSGYLGQQNPEYWGSAAAASSSTLLTPPVQHFSPTSLHALAAQYLRMRSQATLALSSGSSRSNTSNSTAPSERAAAPSSKEGGGGGSRVPGSSPTKLIATGAVAAPNADKMVTATVSSSSSPSPPSPSRVRIGGMLVSDRVPNQAAVGLLSGFTLPPISIMTQDRERAARSASSASSSSSAAAAPPGSISVPGIHFHPPMPVPISDADTSALLHDLLQKVVFAPNRGLHSLEASLAAAAATGAAAVADVSDAGASMPNESSASSLTDGTAAVAQLLQPSLRHALLAAASTPSSSPAAASSPTTEPVAEAISEEDERAVLSTLLNHVNRLIDKVDGKAPPLTGAADGLNSSVVAGSASSPGHCASSSPADMPMTCDQRDSVGDAAPRSTSTSDQSNAAAVGATFAELDAASFAAASQQYNALRVQPQCATALRDVQATFALRLAAVHQLLIVAEAAIEVAIASGVISAAVYTDRMREARQRAAVAVEELQSALSRDVDSLMRSAGPSLLSLSDVSVGSVRQYSRDLRTHIAHQDSAGRLPPHQHSLDGVVDATPVSVFISNGSVAPPVQVFVPAPLAGREEGPASESAAAAIALMGHVSIGIPAIIPTSGAGVYKRGLAVTTHAKAAFQAGAAAAHVSQAGWSTVAVAWDSTSIVRSELPSPPPADCGVGTGAVTTTVTTSQSSSSTPSALGSVLLPSLEASVATATHTALLHLITADAVGLQMEGSAHLGCSFPAAPVHTSGSQQAGDATRQPTKHSIAEPVLLAPSGHTSTAVTRSVAIVGSRA